MSDLTITIDEAGWRDLKDLNRLEHECFSQDTWPLWDLIAVLSLPGIVRLKAVNEDGEMVGFVAGDVRPKEGLGWITTLCVSPASRRKGIASALMDEAEARMGMSRVRLSVRRSNMAAIQLYSRSGYRQVTVWPAYYNGGEDALVLEKIR